MKNEKEKCPVIYWWRGIVTVVATSAGICGWRCSEEWLMAAAAWQNLSVSCPCHVSISVSVCEEGSSSGWQWHVWRKRKSSLDSRWKGREEANRQENEEGHIHSEETWRNEEKYEEENEEIWRKAHRQGDCVAEGEGRKNEVAWASKVKEGSFSKRERGEEKCVICDNGDEMRREGRRQRRRRGRRRRQCSLLEEASWGRGSWREEKHSPTDLDLSTIAIPMPCEGTLSLPVCSLCIFMCLEHY